MPIVAATGIAAPNRSGRAALAELAMREALDKAVRGGITDPAELKRRILRARELAKRQAG